MARGWPGRADLALQGGSQLEWEDMLSELGLNPNSATR